MDNNFIENCKLLKRHFTKLTQADTTTQSNFTNLADENAAKVIIDDAKKILLTEQIEELSNEDIALLKERSVNKYAKELQKFETKQTYRSCKKENIKWNDEIFDFPLPHPKYNAEYLKLNKTNIDTEIENEKKEIEELANIIFNKYEGLELGTKYNPKKSKIGIEIENKIYNEDKGYGMIDKEKIEAKINFELGATSIEMKQNENFEVLKSNKVQIPNNTEEKCIEITDIPELKVTPQNNKKVEFLEVKKINIEDKEFKADFDVKEEKDMDKNKEMLSNTIVKWKKYTKQNKNTKINNAHIKKIDNFLENLQKFQLANANKSKSDLTNKNSQNPAIITTKIKPKSSTFFETKLSSYEHRFKAQKDIIEMQKQKLEEQTKLIEELKLNKINKDARESLDKATEMKKITLSPLKYKSKPKLEVKPEINDSENDNELNFTLNFNKAPKIVKMMEDRARERHERRLFIQERKRVIEEERKRQAEELVQRKLKEETEEKQKRLERMKKQRDIVRQIELKKQLEKKRYIKLNEKAAEHYKTKLKNTGIKYFKMLIYDVKIKTEIAKRFYENNIIIICFKVWYNFSSEIVNNRNKLATNFHTKNLLEKMMRCWKSYQFEAIQSKQVAIDRYEMSLQNKYFIRWHKLVCEYRVQYTINAQKADRYFRRILLFHCFENWRSLPAIMQIERVQNERKRKWRLRVAEILSDYDPLKNYDFDLIN